MKEFAPMSSKVMGIESISMLTRADYAQLPLGNIVSAPMDRIRPSGDLVNTAGHELNHGIAALGQNVAIKEISVIPEGLSLGHTTMAGIVSPEKMKIIAAAGAVNPADGSPARGYGGDMMNIRIIDYLTNYRGMGTDQAKFYAGSIISSMYSQEVRERAAYILASLGKIDGSLLPLILARAKSELDLENNKIFTPIDEDLLMMLTAHDPYPESDTILNNYGDGIYGIQYVIAGEKSEEIIFCQACGGEFEHQFYCRTLKNSKSFDRSISVTNPNKFSSKIKPIEIAGSFSIKTGVYSSNTLADGEQHNIQSQPDAQPVNMTTATGDSADHRGKSESTGSFTKKGNIYSFNKPEDGSDQVVVFPPPYISPEEKYSSIIQ